MAASLHTLCHCCCHMWFK